MKKQYCLFTAVLVIFALVLAGCPEGAASTANNTNTGVSFVVTFEANGGSTVAAQLVPSGGKATEPTGVTKTGYTLAGWYKEAAFTNQWNFAVDTVTANITLYANWTVDPDAGRTAWLYENGQQITNWRLGRIETFEDVRNWIANNALQNATYRIVLAEDLNSSARLLFDSAAVNNKTGVTVTIEGKDVPRIITSGITIENNGKLVLEKNIHVKQQGINVGNGGWLEIKDTVKITDCHIGVDVYDGIGVGFFRMSGGEISGCGIPSTTNSTEGHGVYINGGRFEMTGGLITNNKYILGPSSFYYDGGGGVYLNRYLSEGYFKKTGGIITGYGNNPASGNKVVSVDGSVQSGRGHAVKVYGNYSYSLDNTVTANHNLDSTVTGTAGGWYD